MTELRYTLLSDGTSDEMLMPVLDWLLRQTLPDSVIDGRRADFRLRGERPRGLPGRIRAALEDYPCDVLFIHRDAETASLDQRRNEIDEACEEAQDVLAIPRGRVVPVRMTEAWLLFNEEAIRWAAANRNGKVKLALPKLGKLESLPDPKRQLHELLRMATELTGRRRDKFHVQTAVRLVAEAINDFSSLRVLPAFRALEADVRGACRVLFGTPD